MLLLLLTVVVVAAVVILYLETDGRTDEREIHKSLGVVSPPAKCPPSV